MINDTISSMQTYFTTANLANLGIALLVLLIGWVVAVVAAAVVRWLLGKVRFNERMAKLNVTEPVPDDQAPPPDVEKWVGRVVFWLIMLLVLAQFFITLGLTQVGASLAGLSDLFSRYIGRLITAGMVLLLAWIVALLVRFAVLKIAQLTNFDERLKERGGLEEDQPLAASSSLATAAFWLTLLFFLPGVLSALGLDALVAPLQDMVGEVLGAVPNMLEAALILLVGWLLARVVRQIAFNLMHAAGVDQLGARVGFDAGVSSRSLSSLIATVIYALVLIPTAIAALDALDIQAISGPATAMLAAVLLWIPKVFAAGFILVIFYFVGKFVAGIVTSLLRGIGFDTWPVKLGLSEGMLEGARSPSDVAGLLVLVATMLFGGATAAEQLGFQVLQDAFQAAIVFGGQLLIAGIVLVIGLYLANLARTTILSAGGANAVLWARIASLAVVIFAAALALVQVGIGADIVRLAFGLILGAMALSAALAFGLGGREAAARQLDDWLGEFHRRGRDS